MHHGGGLGRLVDHLQATALPAANLSQSKAASIDAAFFVLGHHPWLKACL